MERQSTAWRARWPLATAAGSPNVISPVNIGHYYLSVFDQAELLSINRYGANEAGAEGTLSHATFSLDGQVFICMDSNMKQDFTFTPSISLYVTCATEDEINRLFEKLSQDGNVFMPLMTYPFSEKFAWVADKYGVSWQLNLESN